MNIMLLDDISKLKFKSADENFNNYNLNFDNSSLTTNKTLNLQVEKKIIQWTETVLLTLTKIITEFSQINSYLEDTIKIHPNSQGFIAVNHQQINNAKYQKHVDYYEKNRLHMEIVKSNMEYSLLTSLTSSEYKIKSHRDTLLKLNRENYGQTFFSSLPPHTDIRFNVDQILVWQNTYKKQLDRNKKYFTQKNFDQFLKFMELIFFLKT